MFIGLTKPINIVFGLGLPDLFYPISPAPVVFSKTAGNKKKFNNYSYEILNLNKTKVQDFRFSKKFYNKIPGPHRHKLYYFIFLKPKMFFARRNHDSLIKRFFCNSKFNYTEFSSKEISEIRIKSNNFLISEVSCIE